MDNLPNEKDWQDITTYSWRATGIITVIIYIAAIAAIIEAL